MSWERRGHRLYYFRAKRVNGRLVKQYFGSGPRATRAAEADETVRAIRQRHRESQRERAAVLDGMLAKLDHTAGMVQVLLTCRLLLAGWHQHQRLWRGPRKCRTPER